MNFISPEFLALMEEQAIKREYNAILPARWEVTEGMADDKTLVYFMDAMGVEYLSFILAKCKENDLLANVTICHSEIPHSLVTIRILLRYSEMQVRSLLTVKADIKNLMT